MGYPPVVDSPQPDPQRGHDRVAINHNASVENPVYDIGQLWRRPIALSAACRMLLGTHCSLPELPFRPAPSGVS